MIEDSETQGKSFGCSPFREGRSNTPVLRSGRVSVWHGDCMTVLKGFEACSVDSIVTDPPAGIGFLGKAWDGDRGGRRQWVEWFTNVMAECFRVLKPGGHVFVWSIPRTSHWVGWSLEEAGFEVRDVVGHLFGSGMPKSSNIGKTLDRRDGLVREVVGSYQITGNAGMPTSEKGGTYGVGVGTAPAVDVEVTVPAGEDAKRWDGWGTALKPALECWVLARKPVAESSVAENVRLHGTGGINIDGCRVPHGEDVDLSQSRKQSDVQYKPGGRWPANVVLSHADVCDGVVCVADCPVPELNRQARDDVARFFNVFPVRYVKKAGRSERPVVDGMQHPTVKPLALTDWLVKLITPPDGLVLDPFAGSGTVLESAVRGGFRAVGVESDESYVSLILERLAGTEEVSG